MRALLGAARRGAPERGRKKSGALGLLPARARGEGGLRGALLAASETACPTSAAFMKTQLRGGGSLFSSAFLLGPEKKRVKNFKEENVFLG